MAWCLALLLSQAPMPAADTVLLVRSSDEVFEERLAAELHAAGFRVEDIEIPLDVSGDIPVSSRTNQKRRMRSRRSRSCRAPMGASTCGWRIA